MIRRGQSRKAATKARKNDGKLHRTWSKALVAFVVALTVFMVFPDLSTGEDAGSPSETTQTTQTTTEETGPTVAEIAATKANYRAALKYQRAADRWFHKTHGRHFTYGHRKLRYTGNLEYERWRAQLWKAQAFYRAALHYRKTADKYHHRVRGRHIPYGHGSMKYTKNAAYEVRRMKAWRSKAMLWRKRYVAYINSMRPCRQAGFPRWYCPILTKAAKAERRPTWARDASLAWLISHESGFRPTAQNPTSTAYGLFQFLDSTWAGTGIRKTSDPYWQTRAGIRYIKGRYGTPAGAKRFWQANHWY